MTGLTDYITEKKWEDIFIIWYVLVDDAYQQLIISLEHRLRRRGPEPTFGDSEVITVSLIIETFSTAMKTWGWLLSDNITTLCFHNCWRRANSTADGADSPPMHQPSH